MKTTEKVIVDMTFGLGPRFVLRIAEFNEKTVTFRHPQENPSNAVVRHRRSSQLFAKLTKELGEEALAINELMNEVDKRARAFRLKLKEVAL